MEEKMVFDKDVFNEKYQNHPLSQEKRDELQVYIDMILKGEPLPKNSMDKYNYKFLDTLMRLSFKKVLVNTKSVVPDEKDINLENHRDAKNNVTNDDNNLVKSSHTKKKKTDERSNEHGKEN